MGFFYFLGSGLLGVSFSAASAASAASADPADPADPGRPRQMIEQAENEKPGHSFKAVTGFIFKAVPGDYWQIYNLPDSVIAGYTTCRSRY